MQRGSKHAAGALAALMMFATTGPAGAAGACFLPSEIEAEQAVRYQARLMVLSDMCRDDTYRTFTGHNRDLIVLYQKQLIERFRRNGERRPETSFENYMTGIANELSLANGSDPVVALCRRSAAFLQQAAALDKAQFRHHVEQLVDEHRATYRTCTK